MFEWVLNVPACAVVSEEHQNQWKKPKIKKRVQQPQQRVLNLQRNRKFSSDLDCL